MIDTPHYTTGERPCARGVSTIGPGDLELKMVDRAAESPHYSAVHAGRRQRLPRGRLLQLFVEFKKFHIYLSSVRSFTLISMSHSSSHG